MITRSSQKLAKRLARHLPASALSLFTSIKLGLAISIVAAGVRLAFDPLLHGAVPFITFIPAVLLASFLGGAIGGCIVALLGAAVAYSAWLSPNWPYPDARAAVNVLAFLVISGCLITIAGLFRALVGVERAAQERATTISQEMKHRANNLLGIVLTISAQTVRGTQSLADFEKTFRERVVALSRAQEFLFLANDETADLGQFVDRVLEPFELGRMTRSGPVVTLPRDNTPLLALLLHELATNAAKYGALSVPDGEVHVTWALGDDGIDMAWREENGPPVLPPSRAGFGSRLIGSALSGEKGSASLDYHPDGVRCRINFRLAA